MKDRPTLLALTLAMLLAGCSSPQQTQQSAAPPAAPPPPVATGPVAPPTTEEGMIKSAMSAAPEAVAKDATIIAIDDKMNVKTLRKGTNMWTCMPDAPSPGVDPMCLDKNGLEWAQAWMAHKKPPADKIGFGYMLAGGSDASNDDPFATAPADGKHWVDTGPHIMILNIGNRFAGYPAAPDDPKQPYIMWGKTPYAHLMIPVR